MLLLILLFAGFNILHLNAQIITFTADSSRVVISDRIDSIFVFDQSLGVTAIGKGISRLQYHNSSIAGDSIPPTLKINHPAGAIMYSRESAFPEIPIIIGRQNRKMSLDQLLREYLFALNDFKGQSEKGGIRNKAADSFFDLHEKRADHRQWRTERERQNDKNFCPI
jgi:hypothetical protein